MTDATDVALEKAALKVNKLRADEVGGCFRPEDAPQDGECADSDCYCARQCRQEAKAAIEAYQAALPKGELAAQLNEYANDIGQGAILRRDLNAVIRCLRAAASLLGGGVPEGWQPIETAPKDEDVLVFMPGAAQGMDIEIAHQSSDDPDGDWYPGTHDGSPLDVPPTRWRPMPARPPQSGRE